MTLRFTAFHFIQAEVHYIKQAGFEPDNKLIFSAYPLNLWLSRLGLCEL